MQLGKSPLACLRCLNWALPGAMILEAREGTQQRPVLAPAPSGRSPRSAFQSADPCVAGPRRVDLPGTPEACVLAGDAARSAPRLPRSDYLNLFSRSAAADLMTAPPRPQAADGPDRPPADAFYMVTSTGFALFAISTPVGAPDAAWRWWSRPDPAWPRYRYRAHSGVFSQELGWGWWFWDPVECLLCPPLYLH